MQADEKYVTDDDVNQMVDMKPPCQEEAKYETQARPDSLGDVIDGLRMDSLGLFARESELNFNNIKKKQTKLNKVLSEQ